MTTYKTGNPLGSVSPKDLFDNSENLDRAVNGAALIWKDRFDRSRLSWAGIEDRARIDIVAAAEQAAEEATIQAAELRDQAQVARDDARSARDDAIAAAAASGEFVFAETYADALGKLPLPEGAVVEVGRDETLDESRTRYVVEGNQLRFAVNLDLVRIALAQPNGAEIVGFRRPEMTAVRRNLLDRGNDTVSVLDYIDTIVDGETSNQNGIVAAVAAAGALGADLNWPAADGDYVSTDSIPGFWNVRHTGPGRIKRGNAIWHITPVDDQENTIWVAPGAQEGNDGLSLTSPLGAQSAFDRLSRIGSKAADGQWTVRISGAINYSGVRISRPLPVFTRRLQILGDDVPGLNDVPTTIWDGSGSSLNYAFRIERNVAPALFLLMRNIKFVNWDKGAGSGAVVIWDAGGVRGENLHVDGADVGLWFNRCDVVIERGVIENCTTRGASFEYHSKFNIGRVDRDYGVTIKNCGSGVQIGRHTVGYVQGCILENNRVNINPSRISRWRSRNNLHKNWIDAAYNSSLVGVFTPDNDAGQPDIFEHTDPNAQVYVAQQGSIHMHIERGGHRTVHLVSDGNLVDIANRSGASVLLSAEGGPSFTPFRLPAFALKNTSIRIDVEILALVSAGATGVFALNGAAPGTGVRMASCTIPSLGSNTTYKIVISVFRQPGLSTVRYRVKLETANGHSIQSGSFSNPNNAAISAHAEAQLLYRLYWEPTTNANVRFYAMRSYVEY